MRDELLEYYERELTFLRRSGAEFGKKYPRVASRLMLEPTKCDDPHVERLLEGFAFLAARVHLKIDDDFPEISEALLNVVYPNYIRPVPSMSVVEFRLDPEQGKLASGFPIPRDTPLYSRPVGGAPCRFRTCYDTTLWPINVAQAGWVAPHELKPAVRAADAVGAVRLVLECLPEVSFADLELDRLRFYLNAESNTAGTLYELLLNNCTSILLRPMGKGAEGRTITLPAKSLEPVGFEESHSMLPYPKRAFSGYRILQEYFAFPEKFHFLDLDLRGANLREFGTKVEVIFLVSPFERGERKSTLEAGVRPDTFRLGCSPIINLFEKESEPILLTQRKQEYLVVADARRRATTGIFSVDRVTGVSPGAGQPLRFEPFFSFRHGADGDKRLFWYAKRRPVRWGQEDNTDLLLSFVDLTGRSVHPDQDAATARLTCYNGNLPSRLPFGSEAGDFELPGGGPIDRIVTLVKPTEVVEPPLGKPQLWRLISQLSLNYVSLVEGGAEGFQELLRLHNFGERTTGEKQIQGIRALQTEPCYARIESEHGLTFARGHRVDIEFDEEWLVGGGVYLFASVLERFLALYVSLNSFAILAARTRQRKELMKEWPPRSGRKALL